MEQIAKQQGLKWTHVPSKGNADAMNALLGGHIHAVGIRAVGHSWSMPGASACWSPGVQPAKNWPTVPTLREIGIDMVANSPFGIAGPKGIDPKVVKVLHDAFKKGLEDPSYVEAMAKLDMEQFYLSSEDYQKFALQQIEEARRFIAELGLGPKAE